MNDIDNLAALLRDLDEALQQSTLTYVNRAQGRAITKALRAIVEKLDSTKDLLELRRRVGDLERERDMNRTI